MFLRLVGVGILALTGVASDEDDRDPLISDVQRGTVAEVRPGAQAEEMVRHYEGLRHFARGRLLERKDRLPEAMQAYEMALQVDPNAVALMRVCIPVNFKLERTVPALRLMREALQREPNQPDLWLRYAQELLEIQRHEDVVRTVRQALQAADFKATPAFRADLYVAQASAYDALQLPGEAVRSYQEALRIIEDREHYLEDFYSPLAEELPAEQAKLLERLARAQLKAGEIENALATFRRADTVHPGDDGRLDLNLAEALLAAKRPVEALRHLRACLDKLPPGDEAYRFLVEALRQSGKEADILPELEKLRDTKPEPSAIRLVLAEQYAVGGRQEEAGRLFREVMTVEPIPIKAACRGYLRLLVEQGKGKEALQEYQGLCRRPEAASWVRAMTLALLEEPKLLGAMLDPPATQELSPTVRGLLLKLALQAHLWPAAEGLARRQVAQDPKPTEAYLLWCQGLLEQRRYLDLAEVCRQAIRNEAVTQPSVFHVELAKALALTRQEEPALQALQTARRLVSPNSTEEQKVFCTELYVLHLLGRNQDCIRQGEGLLKTDLAKGPWARQVRYLLAHAYEAMAQYDQALAHLKYLLREDPNDDEAAAAKARCLFLQSRRLDEAEACIREAIELEYVAQVKRNKTNPVPTPSRPNPHYQATLGAILLRAGRTAEGVALLKELAGTEANHDPWVLLCLGDGWLCQQQRNRAEQCWRQAERRLEEGAILGINLRPSVQARLRSLSTSVTQTGAVSPAVPPSLSSPGRP